MIGTVGNKYLQTMGKKIKATRLKNKLSLPKLSKLSGIDLSTLWFIENGQSNVHILTLKKIADAYKIDVKDFL
jgi:transcriptional regulator with XRE-family HTH domain